MSKELVRDVYAAFGRGDLPAVLAACDEHVDWRYAGPASAPYSGAFTGRYGVKRFFELFLSNLALSSFEPKRFLCDGDTVVVLGRESGTASRTGRAGTYDWVHVFVVADGRIMSFREFPDATAVDALFR